MILDIDEISYFVVCLQSIISSLDDENLFLGFLASYNVTLIKRVLCDVLIYSLTLS